MYFNLLQHVVIIIIITCSSSYQPSRVPPDHLVTMLEAMTTMCHYCLLDGTQQDALIAQQIPGSSGTTITDTASSGHLFSNLISVFNPYGNNRVRIVSCLAANSLQYKMAEDKYNLCYSSSE